MQSIAEDGERRDEIRSDVDSAELAMLIASTLEGGHQLSRLQKRKSLVTLPSVIWSSNTSKQGCVRGKRTLEPTSHDYSRNSLAP
jgi:hypothetical protein